MLEAYNLAAATDSSAPYRGLHLYKAAQVSNADHPGHKSVHGCHGCCLPAQKIF